MPLASIHSLLGRTDSLYPVMRILLLFLYFYGYCTILHHSISALTSTFWSCPLWFSDFLPW
jgi:hypothetical protein